MLHFPGRADCIKEACNESFHKFGVYSSPIIFLRGGMPVTHGVRPDGEPTATHPRAGRSAAEMNRNGGSNLMANKSGEHWSRRLPRGCLFQFLMISFRMQNQISFYLCMYLTILARNPRPCQIEYVKLSILALFFIVRRKHSVFHH